MVPGYWCFAANKNSLPLHKGQAVKTCGTTLFDASCAHSTGRHHARSPITQGMRRDLLLSTQSQRRDSARPHQPNGNCTAPIPVFHHRRLSAIRLLHCQSESTVLNMVVVYHTLYYFSRGHSIFSTEKSIKAFSYFSSQVRRQEKAPQFQTRGPFLLMN